MIREAVALVVVCSLGVLMASLGVNAQPATRVPRVGILLPSVESPGAFLDPFRQGLRDVGYVDGRNVTIEYRSTDKADRLPDLAAELVRLRVDVIVAISSPAVRAAKQATGTIPIVMGAVDDAVEQGFAASLARPGGNVTGVSWLNTELSAKRLQLLREALPAVSRVALLREAVGGASAVRATAAAAQSLGVRLQLLELREVDELDSAFAAMARERVGALTVLAGPMVTTHMRRIVDLAAKNRLPAIFPDRRFVEVGGLLSYGPSLPHVYRNVATYIDKILKGFKPAELPIEQPARFEMVVNLKAARPLGLTMPPSLLVRADHVIQ